MTRVCENCNIEIHPNNHSDTVIASVNGSTRFIYCCGGECAKVIEEALMKYFGIKLTCQKA